MTIVRRTRRFLKMLWFRVQEWWLVRFGAQIEWPIESGVDLYCPWCGWAGFLPVCDDDGEPIEPWLIEHPFSAECPRCGGIMLEDDAP